MKKAAGIASGKMLDYGVRKKGRDRDRKEEREKERGRGKLRLPGDL